MTKVTIKAPSKITDDYPKIMINCITGSIFWFHRECVGVLLKRGELEINKYEIATMCVIESMKNFTYLNGEIVLQNI